MPKELISQEELEAVAPEMIEELEVFIGESDIFKDSEEATIYALTQLLHNQLEKLDLSLEDKGGVVASLIDGLCDFNCHALAAHREFLRAIIEQKASTVH